jgi:hypothetical protein
MRLRKCWTNNIVDTLGLVLFVDDITLNHQRFVDKSYCIKIFLEFRNTILEVKLSKKFKNGHKNFHPSKAFLKIVEIHGFRISKHEVPKPLETPEKFS